MSAAVAYLAMASDDPALAAEAEKHTLDQLATAPTGQERSKLFGQIRLSRVRFLAGEPEQASADGHRALDLAEGVASTPVKTRLRELLAGAAPYRELPAVRELQVRAATALRSGD